MWPRMHEHIVERYAAYPITIAMLALRTGEETHLELARMTLAAHERHTIGARGQSL
jgi:macrolide phosphotransferase